ncbi:hypothetical protein Slin14017_G097720 [Septoria linicola]|nr:hypothetical protein Slin14017_G097720 [Septoria linicola]
MRHLSPNFTYLGNEFGPAQKTAPGDASPREQLIQAMRFISKQKPGFDTQVLDCEVILDRRKHEATAWLLVRQKGLCEGPAMIGLETVVKYQWQKTGMIWQCDGFVGITGAGGWTLNDAVPLDTQNFIDGDLDGSLLEINEYNFSPRREKHERPPTAEILRKNQMQRQPCGLASTEDPSAPWGSVDTVKMLLAESERRGGASNKACMSAPVKPAHFTTIIPLFPHVDEALKSGFVQYIAAESSSAQ